MAALLLPDERSSLLVLRNAGGNAGRNDEVRSRVTDAEHPLDRVGALQKLARSGDPEAAGTLVRALQDPDRRVRLAAATLLGKPVFESERHALHSALARDDDVGVRGAAARSLAVVGNDESVRLLRKHLDDPKHIVRQYVVVALAALGDSDGVAHALADPHPHVRLRAAVRAPKLQTEGSELVTALESALRADRHLVRRIIMRWSLRRVRATAP